MLFTNKLVVSAIVVIGSFCNCGLFQQSSAAFLWPVKTGEVAVQFAGSVSARNPCNENGLNQNSTSTKADDNKTKNTILGKVVLSNGDNQRGASIVQCSIDENIANAEMVTLVDSGGNRLPGQISDRATVGQTRESGKVLTFIVPGLKPNQSVEYQILNEGLDTARNFTWHDDGSTQAELQLGDVSVMKYMYEEVDHSTEKATSRDL